MGFALENMYVLLTPPLFVIVRLTGINIYFAFKKKKKKNMIGECPEKNAVNILYFR